MPPGRTAVLTDPFGAIARVRTVLPDVVGAVIVDAGPAMLRVDLRLAPPLEFATAGYPIEPVRIALDDFADAPQAYPLRAGLTWFHRNPDPSSADGQGALCLWYPRDPKRLRWTWDDGLEQYVAIVHRHLIGEEWYRREGAWPWPDTPHGNPPDGRAHPVPRGLRSA